MKMSELQEARVKANFTGRKVLVQNTFRKDFGETGKLTGRIDDYTDQLEVQFGRGKTSRKEMISYRSLKFVK